MNATTQNGPAGYAPGFQFTGFNVSLTGKDADPWPRALYAVDDATRAWDGTTRSFALYSDLHKAFSYCSVRITGRRVRWNGNYRVTVRVDFDGEGGTNHAGIMLHPDGSSFEMDEAHVAVLEGRAGTPTTRIRSCPTCCPTGGAYFYRTYEAADEWECSNCGHTVVIKPRRSHVGTPSQDRVVARLRDQLAKRFEVSDGDDDGYWAGKGVVVVYAKAKQWFDDSLIIYVGPRGSLRVVDCGKGEPERKGRDATIWINIRSI